MDSNIVRLGTVMITQSNGGPKVSYMYDIVNESGDPVSQNKRQSFYAIDPAITEHIDAIREYILTKRNNS